MSESHSLAQKKRWAKVSSEERSKMMSELVSFKHAKMTKAEKHKMAMKMVAGKRK